MNLIARLAAAFLVLLALACPAFVGAAAADDTLKVAAGAHGNWETAAPQLGLDAGFFKKHGIALDLTYTQGSGETQQALVAGGVDIGIGLGTSSVMAAFVKGAPLRIVANCTTGPPEYWYVRGDSPIRSMKDVAGKTVAYSTARSSSYVELLALFKFHGVEGKPVATGAPAPTLVQLMSGQIDVGWSSPPFGIDDASAGKLRIIAHAMDLPSYRDQTVRVMATNAAYLAQHTDLIRRFLQAYQETLDWMYTTPEGLKAYAAFAGVGEAAATRVRDEFYPPASEALNRISGLDALMEDAVTWKYLAEPLTKAQLAELFQIMAPGK